MFFAFSNELVNISETELAPFKWFSIFLNRDVDDDPAAGSLFSVGAQHPQATTAVGSPSTGSKTVTLGAFAIPQPPSAPTATQEVSHITTATTRFPYPGFQTATATNPRFGAPATTAATLLSHSEGYVKIQCIKQYCRGYFRLTQILHVNS